MNLNRYEDELLDILNDQYNLDAECESEDDRIIINADLYLTDLPDEGILFQIVIDDSESAIVTFTLDKVDDYDLDDAYKLANDINDAQAVFKTSIDDDGYIYISHFVYDTNEPRKFGETVKFLLNKFVDDDMIDLLKPICDLTE